MISVGEIQRSLTGVWRIVRRLPGASECFDQSFDGFARSFNAMLLAAPLILISAASVLQMAMTLEESRVAYDGISLSQYALVELGGSIFGWGSFLLLMAPLTRQLELGGAYTSYVITYNWGMLGSHILFALPLSLYLLGLLSNEAAALLSVPAMAMTGYYRYLIAREVLGASMTSAVGIVALNVIYSLIINQISGMIFFPSIGAS